MKASELIKRLIELKKEHGDLPIATYNEDDSDDYLITTVSYEDCEYNTVAPRYIRIV